MRVCNCGFETHRRHCIVSLSKTHLSLLSTQVQPRKTRPDITEKIVDWDVKNQNKGCVFNIHFTYFSNKTYAVGTQKGNLLLSCQPRVTVMTCFVHRVIRDL